MRDEALRSDEKLRRRSDYLRCYNQGSRRRGRLVTLFVACGGTTQATPRLGITVSRKVGGAVVRQRIKRRIREIYRRWSERSRLPPCDILVHVNPAARTADFSRLQQEIERLLVPLLGANERHG